MATNTVRQIISDYIKIQQVQQLRFDLQDYFSSLNIDYFSFYIEEEDQAQYFSLLIKWICSKCELLEISYEQELRAFKYFELILSKSFVLKEIFQLVAASAILAVLHDIGATDSQFDLAVKYFVSISGNNWSNENMHIELVNLMHSRCPIPPALSQNQNIIHCLMNILPDRLTHNNSHQIKADLETEAEKISIQMNSNYNICLCGILSSGIISAYNSVLKVIEGAQNSESLEMKMREFFQESKEEDNLIKMNMEEVTKLGLRAPKCLREEGGNELYVDMSSDPSTLGFSDEEQEQVDLLHIQYA